MSPYCALSSPCVTSMSCCLSPYYLQLKYKEDYNKNVKGQWCETPYFDVATARVAMENLSSVKYQLLSLIIIIINKNIFFCIANFWCIIIWFCLQLFRAPCFSLLQRRYTQDWEAAKDQINFMQTETPVYDTNKKAGTSASSVSKPSDDDCPPTHATLTLTPPSSACLNTHLAKEEPTAGI